MGFMGDFRREKTKAVSCFDFLNVGGRGLGERERREKSGSSLVVVTILSIFFFILLFNFVLSYFLKELKNLMRGRQVSH